MMTTPSELKRFLRTSVQILSREGLGGFSSAIRHRLALKRQLNAFGKADSIAIDGCVFNLKQLPDSLSKLALVGNGYEEFERRATLKYAHPEKPIIELGASIGVLACITNRALKNARPHIVVEASPLTIPLLEDSRSRNQCDFEIINAAVAYGQKTVSFTPTWEFAGNSLREQNQYSDRVTVNTIQLGDIVQQKQIDTFTLICDIEGHEYELVEHEAVVLERAETIILETHARMIGEAKNLTLLGKLRDLGFQKIDEEATVVVLKQST